MSKVIRWYKHKRRPFVVAQWIDPRCGIHVVDIDWGGTL